jgi:hypothetical protein
VIFGRASSQTSATRTGVEQRSDMLRDKGAPRVGHPNLVHHQAVSDLVDTSRHRIARSDFAEPLGAEFGDAF